MLLSGARVTGAIASLILAIVAGLEPYAAADPKMKVDQKEICRSAYEQGQVDRGRGKLRSALAQFRVCSRDPCAPFMRVDCARWIDEVGATLPSLVVAVRDTQGNDVVDVRLLIDGEVRQRRLGGVPFDLDPGEHIIRVEADGATFAERQVLVRVGEKNRRIELMLASVLPSRETPAPPFTPRPELALAKAAPPSSVAATAASAAPNTGIGGTETGAERRAGRLPAYLLTGAAVAGLGVFTTFAVLGKSLENDRSRSCAPSCTDDQVAAIRTRYRIADIGLGVGLLSAAAAAYFWFAGPAPVHAAAGSGLVFSPAPGGVTLIY